MVNLSQKHMGISLIIISIVLIILLSFVKSNVDTQEAYLCEISHSSSDLDITQCPAHTSSNSWLIIVAFGFSFVLLGGGIYLTYVPLKKPIEKIDFKEVDLSTLEEDEKRIYGILKHSGGYKFQGDLIKETSMSKVQITRLLDKLEAKKVIERKRRGMSNVIILK